MMDKVVEYQRRANAVVLSALSAIALSSCSNLDREYKQQYWERCHTASVRALHKNNFRLAGALAHEAVSAAEGTGDSDFRLGVGLCDLGDAERGAGRSAQAESAYKRSIQVLERAAASGAGGDLLSRLALEDLANSMSRLADLYKSEDRLQDAARCFEQASEKYQAVIDAKSARVVDGAVGQKFVQCLLGLAQVSRASDNLEAAQQAYRRALSVAAAADSPEYLLRDIRDADLKLLQQLGKQDEGQDLTADALYNQFTGDGFLALSEGDFTSAEILFRKSLQAARQSVFSDRRVLHSLSNLVAVFSKEGKFPQLEQCSKLADEFVQSHHINFDPDYDQILSTMSNYCIAAGQYQLAAAALEKQMNCRASHFGPNSKEVCDTLSTKGQVEFKLNKFTEANRDAFAAYKIITSHAGLGTATTAALTNTAGLMSDLNHFEEAEALTKLLIEHKSMVVGPADPFMIGLRMNLFMLYHRFSKHDQAKKTIDEIIASLQKGSSRQKKENFGSLVFILSYCVACGWFDLAKIVAGAGEEILHNEMSGVFPDQVSEKSWTLSLDYMKKHDASLN